MTTQTMFKKTLAMLLVVAMCFSNFIAPAMLAHATVSGGQLSASSMQDDGPLATNGVIAQANVNELWAGTYSGNSAITLNNRSYEGTFTDDSGFFTRDNFQIMAVYVQPEGAETATKLGSQYATSYDGGQVASYSVGYYKDNYSTQSEGYLDYRLSVTAVGNGDIWFYVSDHAGYSVYHITCAVTAANYNVYFYDHDSIEATVSVSEGASVPANNIPSISAYVDTDGVSNQFIGWSTKENGSGTLYSASDIAAMSITQNTAFYAVYAAQYGVNYVTGTDAVITDASMYTIGAGVTINQDNVSLSKTGYEFKGWLVTDANGNTITMTDGTQMSGVTFAMPSSNVTITAQWNLISYPITYGNITNGDTYEFADSANASNGNQSTYTVESGDIVLQDASKAGYTFEGWYADADLTTPVTGTAIAAGSTGDATFYASWSMNSYNIAFDLNGGTAGVEADDESSVNWDEDLFASTYDYYDAITKPANPYILDTPATDYTFNGWSLTENGAVVTVPTNAIADATYYAIFGEATMKYSITFKTGVGADLDDETNVIGMLSDVAEYENGKTYELSTQAPQRDGYTFIGWETEEVEEATDGYSATAPDLENDMLYKGNIFTMPTQDTTLTAIWNATDYTVSYLDTDGSALANEATYHMGDAVGSVIPTKAGYAFVGWSASVSTKYTTAGEKVAMSDDFNAQTGTFTMPMANVTLTAQWVKTYTVSYDINGGTALTDATVPETTTYHENTVVSVTGAEYIKHNALFLGWADGNGNLYQADDTITLTGDITLTAQWEGLYTVSYLTGTSDAVENMPSNSELLQSGTVYTVSSNIPARAGYEFDGWSATGLSEYQAQFNMPETNVTLTAQWIAIDYTVEFLDDDGTELSTAIYNYGDTVVAPADPSKDATAEFTYGFAGWSPEVEETVTGDAEYTATYEAEVNAYTVTFLDEDGTVLDSTDYDYGDTVVAPEDPSKENTAEFSYGFAGWSPEVEETVTGDAEYTATYEAEVNAYTVTFLDEDGTVLDSTDYDYGDTVVAPEDPSKDATAQYTYAFAGWTPEVEETVTGDAEYTATYEATAIETPETPADPTTDPDPTPETEEEPVVPTTPTTPATPTTPTTPVTPSTPTEPVFADEPTVEIEDVEVPLASAADTTTEIEDAEVPLVATAVTASWALVNLILAIGTAAVSLILLVGYFVKRRDDQDEEQDDQDDNKGNKGFMRMLSILPAALSVLCFVLTENMRNPMVFVDKWTLAMLLIALIQMAVVIKVGQNEDNEDDIENAYV